MQDWFFFFFCGLVMKQQKHLGREWHGGKSRSLVFLKCSGEDRAAGNGLRMGTQPARAVSVPPPKLHSGIVVIALFYSPSPFNFFPISCPPPLFEMVISITYNNLSVIPALNYRGLSTVFVLLHPVPPVFWHRGYFIFFYFLPQLHSKLSSAFSCSYCHLDSFLW